MFGAIDGGMAAAVVGGAWSKLFGGGEKGAFGGIQGEVPATDNNNVCFFQSRRRHTRCSRDWSSDVCSSDLTTTSGIRVVDDYAHNGEKIRAAVTTAQAGAPRVVAVFQPHGFGPARFLRQELKELLPRLLRPQDRFCYAEIFYTGGTVAKDVSSRALAADLPAEMRCGYARDHDAVRQWALSEAQAGDTVLIMGARDPDLPRLARKVFESLSVWASSTSSNLLGWR